MLVKDCMTKHPIMLTETAAAAEAQKLMFENKVRHLPVTGSGKRLVGLVTRQTLAISPDLLGSLNVWEISRYLSGLTVNKAMIKVDKVLTITPNNTVERAAKIMSDNKVGCLPVIDEDNAVVGIVTEVDLLKTFQLMLGLPTNGIRATVRMPNQPGEFVKLMTALSENSLGVLGIGTYPSPRVEGHYDAVIKIVGKTAAEVESVLNGIEDQEVVDIRDAV